MVFDFVLLFVIIIPSNLLLYNLKRHHPNGYKQYSPFIIVFMLSETALILFNTINEQDNGLNNAPYHIIMTSAVRSIMQAMIIIFLKRTSDIFKGIQVDNKQYKSMMQRAVLYVANPANSSSQVSIYSLFNFYSCFKSFLGNCIIFIELEKQ